jgi:hypothetical protein
MTIYCGECGSECVVTVQDHGIGETEAWGVKSTHHDYQTLTACCECDTVYTNKCSSCKDKDTCDEGIEIDGENYCCESAASKYLKDNL